MSIDTVWNKIKKGEPFFIAEAGVNHLQDWKLAERLIKGAKEGGADAIKWQTYKAKDLCVKDAPRFWDWDGEVKKDGSQYDSYKELDGWGEEEHIRLKKCVMIMTLYSCQHLLIINLLIILKIWVCTYGKLPHVIVLIIHL